MVEVRLQARKLAMADWHKCLAVVGVLACKIKLNTPFDKCTNFFIIEHE
jgi:hypothetical protein